MVRLGYSNCAACHIAPQGGGLLTPYGKTIDVAQSLRGGEYEQSVINKAFDLGGRLTQDVRAVMSDQAISSPGQSWSSVFRTRLFYRNATQLSKGLRVSAIVLAENEPIAGKILPYRRPGSPGAVMVTQAMAHYRLKEGLEFAGGRDQLPTGVYLPDQSLFVRSRNRLGYYDNPTQAKVFWWGSRYQVSPFIFGSSGREPVNERESGGGILAEYDILGKQRTIVGATLLRGNGRFLDRNVTGVYARLGFGRWGVFAEHDFTGMKRNLERPVHFGQHTSLVQVFLAHKEWLVYYGTWERLSVARPYEERLSGGKFEVAARLSNLLTVSGGIRVGRDHLTGRTSTGLVAQVAMKTWQ
jgi:hypothetical protein